MKSDLTTASAGKNEINQTKLHTVQLGPVRAKLFLSCFQIFQLGTVRTLYLEGTVPLSLKWCAFFLLLLLCNDNLKGRNSVSII